MTKKEYILDFLKEINCAYNHPGMYDDLKRLLDEMEEEVVKNESENYKKGWHDALEKALKKSFTIIDEDGCFKVVQEETLIGLGMSMPTPKICNWIPVTERLPDKLQDVIVAFDDAPGEYDIAYMRKTFNATYKANGAENEWVSAMGETTYADYEVNAWMPIPTYNGG